MRILITGASGFLGQELASSLLQDPPFFISDIVLTDLNTSPVPSIPSHSSTQLIAKAVDLTEPSAVPALLTPTPSHIFLLHGIMSGASESNLDLGLAVNLTASLNILNHIRTLSTPVIVIYASVLAAYGPPSLLADPHQPINETNTAPNPQSSYGAEKIMIETLINDFSRRGLIDGRILRLPTIMPRAGAPTGAASSFASDIVREPLNGRTAVLPVGDKRLKMYVCSPRTIIENFKHAMTIPKASFERYRSRVTIMPGVVATVQDVLDALVTVNPNREKILDLIEEEPDEAIERIVSSWPSQYDLSRARELGFVEDAGLEQSIREYLKKYIKIS